MLKFRKIPVPTILLFIFPFVSIVLPGIIGVEVASSCNLGIIGLLVGSILFKSKKNKGEVKMNNIIIPLFFVFFILQLVCFRSVAIIRLGMNFYLFYLFYRYGTYQLFNGLSWSIKIVCIICTLSVVYSNFRYGNLLYYRHEAIVDKSALTFLYSMTSFMCLLDYIYRKHPQFNLILLSFFTIVNVLIVQSKTSLLGIIVEFFLLWIFLPHKRNMLKKILLLVAFVAFVIVFFFPKMILDEGLMYSINRVTGIDFFDYNSFDKSLDRMSQTFDIRNDIRLYCFKLFNENPIIGIGFANYRDINASSSNYFNDIGDTESSWVQIMVEGGAFFIICMSSFFLYPIILGYTKIKKITNSSHIYYKLMGISFFAIFAILFFYNDFLFSVFWVSAGLMLSLIVHNEYSYGINR